CGASRQRGIGRRFLGAVLYQVAISLDEPQDTFLLCQQVTCYIDLFDQLSTPVVARKACERNARTREQFLNAVVLSKENHGRNSWKEFVLSPCREQQVPLQKIGGVVKVRSWRRFFKSGRECPEQPVVKIAFLC